MYFFFASMAAEVPWANCDNWWNTELCVTPDQAANISRNYTYSIVINLYNAAETKSLAHLMINENLNISTLYVF